MNQHQLPSDIVGLAKVMPPLSRRGSMSSSAAAAAGYTLAAGPVRADVIHTDSKGLEAGDAKVTVPGGDMPVYYARRSGVQHPPIILVCMEVFGVHEFIKVVTRRLGHLGAFAVAPDYYLRNRRCSHRRGAGGRRVVIGSARVEDANGSHRTSGTRQAHRPSASALRRHHAHAAAGQAQRPVFSLDSPP